MRSLGSAIGRDKSREILDYGSAADPASFRSVMRVSSHRFQTKVTISVPLRFSASPRSSSSRKKRARTSTGRLRSRPHRTCSVERVILHKCKIVTPPSKLGGGVCPAISAFSRSDDSCLDPSQRRSAILLRPPEPARPRRARWILARLTLFRRTTDLAHSPKDR